MIMLDRREPEFGLDFPLLCLWTTRIFYIWWCRRRRIRRRIHINASVAAFQVIEAYQARHDAMCKANCYNKIAWIIAKEMSAAGVVVHMNSGFHYFFKTGRKINGLHKNFAGVTQTHLPHEKRHASNASRIMIICD